MDFLALFCGDSHGWKLVFSSDPSCTVHTRPCTNVQNIALHSPDHCASNAVQNVALHSAGHTPPCTAHCIHQQQTCICYNAQHVALLTPASPPPHVQNTRSALLSEQLRARFQSIRTRAGPQRAGARGLPAPRLPLRPPLNLARGGRWRSAQPTWHRSLGPRQPPGDRSRRG